MAGTHVLTTLRDLIRTCREGERRFAAAEEAASGSEVKTALQLFELQRSKFTAVLERLVVGLSGEANAGEPPLHLGQRTLMRLRAAAPNGGDNAILAECQAREREAATRYREALKADLPAPVRALLVSQERSVRATYETLKRLRDHARDGA